MKKAIEGITLDESVSIQNGKHIDKMKQLLSEVHAANKESAQRSKALWIHATPMEKQKI